MEINSQRPLTPLANNVSAEAGKAAGKAVRPAPVPANPVPVTPAIHASGVLQTQQANQKELQLAVDALQRKVQLSVSNLHFSIDNETGRTVVKVTDGTTKEVIRQIPPEEILKLDKALDKMWGLLLNKKG
ncbi:MAG: flagellar protein FlaG [Sterolibacterium sp.]